MTAKEIVMGKIIKLLIILLLLIAVAGGYYYYDNYVNVETVTDGTLV